MVFSDGFGGNPLKADTNPCSVFLSSCSWGLLELEAAPAPPSWSSLSSPPEWFSSSDIFFLVLVRKKRRERRREGGKEERAGDLCNGQFELSLSFLFSLELADLTLSRGTDGKRFLDMTWMGYLPEVGFPRCPKGKGKD